MYFCENILMECIFVKIGKFAKVILANKLQEEVSKNTRSHNYEFSHLINNLCKYLG